MPSSTDRTGGKIDWPAALPRTPAAERDRTSKFSVTFRDAVEDIAAQLNQLGVDGWRLSTAAPHRKDDGMPYARANPNDPGVVVRWSMGGNQYAVACDAYTGWRDCARAIGLYIEEKRKMSQRPVTTARDEFATAALPSGDADAATLQRPPHKVLGVSPDAPRAAVREAYRELLKERHPDQGGSTEAVKELRAAKDAMLNGEAES